MMETRIGPGGHVYLRVDGVLVAVHRLVAAAEYGTEAIRGKHIHHLNGVPFDNRPSNLSPLTPAEHMQQHMMNHPPNIQ